MRCCGLLAFAVFTIFLPLARSCWVLEMAGGRRVPTCEALPIWLEIARRCSGAEFETLPKEPLDQLRLRP